MTYRSENMLNEKEIQNTDLKTNKETKTTKTAKKPKRKKPAAANGVLKRTKKDMFLKVLSNSSSIESACKESDFDFNHLFEIYNKNEEFRNTFNEIINLHLETTFIDVVLKNKTPALITFALSNRMPEKYNKNRQSAPDAPEAKQIVFVDKEAAEEIKEGGAENESK
ncbi:hypothetical protein Dip518_000323 [Parelusimicrobium proximum]|uniref:hypothetical protein n=1 Tax=Parelusimicrobium proximum TaxID=3228953 RepID=UPI003D1762D5